MNLEEINRMARNMGFTDTYLNKLQSSNQIINNLFNQDKKILDNQLSQTLKEYETERKKQNQNFIKEGQSAYVDYAKAINPYSTDRSSNARIGLGNSGFSESSLINANNTYQNRYTETKNNYENIFADINSRIAKAKETRNIEEAKLAKEYQERMLENLWRVSEEYEAYKDSLRSSYSGSSGYGYGYGALTDGGYEVDTEYYQGNLNPDAYEYGTFSNGYQPKGISGHGKLKAIGSKIFNTRTLAGEPRTVTQNVWQAQDGTKWYWDGRYNKYIKIGK